MPSKYIAWYLSNGFICEAPAHEEIIRQNN